MSDQVGRLLAQRYRLEQPIGAGASAEVYLAFDTELNRPVAAKLLHPRLAGDPRFLRRFDEEAQAVASLNHPHVVAIYDRGDDDGPFIITEYLAGGSLAAMLDGGRTLSVEQTLVVGLEAARGLTYAHEAGFVHRDIKPANLLFDNEGRLRISDFGLARALAEVAATEPDGSPLGTARYASPEQARGESAGPPGDVYSLSLVLTEAVTGRRPFGSDTALGSLVARIDEPLAVSDELGPIQEVLVAGGRVDPNDRPTAEEFGGALVRASRGLTRPDPLPLVGAAVVAADIDPTIPASTPEMPTPEMPTPEMPTPEMPTLETTTSERPASSSPGPTFDPSDPADLDSTAVGPLDPAGLGPAVATTADAADGPVAADIVPPEAVYDQAREGPHREPHRALAIGLAVFIVIAIAAVAGFGWYQSRTPSHAVPALIGRSEGELESLVGDLGWELNRIETRADDSEPGEIVGQDPDAGARLDEGDVLTVTVSLGPPLVDVPGNLAGLTVPAAEVVLNESGFVLGDLIRTYDEDTSAETVLGLGPEMDDIGELPKGSAVGLLVSDGPPPRELPDLVGVTRNEAELELGELALVAVIEEQASEEVGEGLVISMSPEPGSEINKGADVVVVVSTGPPWILLPDVAGQSPSDAADELEAAGLVVAGTDGPPNQDVVGTDPPPGVPIQAGSEVTLITADG